MNNDLLIEAAFSKMKSNLRFMDNSVQKDPVLFGVKVETMSGESYIFSGWRKGRAGRNLEKKEMTRG